jgi:hypothetical protein
MYRVCKVLSGVGFVILRPVVEPIQWLVKYTKKNYTDGYRTYELLFNPKKNKSRG